MMACSPATRESSVRDHTVTVTVDHDMVGQMELVAGGIFQSASQTPNPLLTSMDSVIWSPPLVLNSGLAGWEPQFPFSPQPLICYLRSPSGFAPPVFPTFPAPPWVQSMGPAGAHPLLATGSARLVISLPSLQP